MNQLVAFFAPTALPNAAGAAVRAQDGAQGGDFANILAQLQNALAGDTAPPIDPIQQAAQSLGQLPPGLVQSADNLSTEELAAQLQSLNGKPVGENTPQIDALLALLNPAATAPAAQPNIKLPATDATADTSVAAMLAALQLQTQSAMPPQIAAEPASTSPQVAPMPPAGTPADIGLRGSIAATEQAPAPTSIQLDAAANAKVAENAAAALLARPAVARSANESQAQTAQPGNATENVAAALLAPTVGARPTNESQAQPGKADTAKRKVQGAPADAAALQTPNAQQPNGKPSEGPTLGTNTQPQADGSQLPANAAAQAKPADGTAPITSLAATPTPALPTLIDAQQMSVTVSAAPQAPVPLEALAVQIARKFEAGVSRFEISLHPAELGQLDISLSVADDGRIHAALRAERPETLELLQRDARSLEQQLRQAGLEVGSNALSFSLSGGAGQQRHAPFSGWPSFADAQDPAGAAKQEAAKAYIAVRNPDGVDIRV
ncbi:MAG: flagellar hook-length control protein FliK [Micropepsaceae bacterium]